MTECTLLFALVFLAAFPLLCGPLTPAWVQAGPDGARIVRIVMDSGDDCPAVQIGDVSLPMSFREPVPYSFRPACELTLPADAAAASVNGQELAIPAADPARIAVIGDTGCRIKGTDVQNCNDPSKWPFAFIASQAAAALPNVVIHVGDYLYREDDCPADQTGKCAGSPSHDTWEAWNADFFSPARSLLPAAPWVFTRGNHEDCTHSWRGWFYYLDPRPFSGICEDYTAPYTVTLGDVRLGMVDSSASRDANARRAEVGVYADQVRSLDGGPLWLVQHHPIWGFKQDDTGLIQLSETMAQAWDAANPTNVELILSGHTHLFEVVAFEKGRPPQIVAGDSGTDLAAAITLDLDGVNVRGVKVLSSASRKEFGFSLLSRSESGWNLSLRGAAGQAIVDCVLPPGPFRCISPK